MKSHLKAPPASPRLCRGRAIVCVVSAALLFVRFVENDSESNLITVHEESIRFAKNWCKNRVRPRLWSPCKHDGQMSLRNTTEFTRINKTRVLASLTVHIDPSLEQYGFYKFIRQCRLVTRDRSFNFHIERCAHKSIYIIF